MTKSTPIHNLQQSNTATSAPIKFVEPPQDVNVEQAMHEFDREHDEPPDGSQLQDQIDLLKMQMSVNAKKSPEALSEPNTGSESLITRNTLMYIGHHFDYKLCIIVFTVCLLLYSSSLREFLFNKLETKQLSYLHPYVLAALVSIVVSMLNKI